VFTVKVLKNFVSNGVYANIGDVLAPEQLEKIGDDQIAVLALGGFLDLAHAEVTQVEEPVEDEGKKKKSKKKAE
jgi:hypothetical protein